MSYPGEPTDDTLDDTDEMSVADPLSASVITKATNEYASGLKARNERLNKEFFAPQQALFDKYAEALKARRAGPDFSERMYQLAGALMKPTAYKGLGATIGNVAPVLAEQRAALRNAQDAKEDLLLKYQMQTQDVKGEQLKSILASEDAQAKARLNALISQYKIMNTPRWVQVPDGKGGVTLMQVTPSSLPAQTAAPRPAGVPADWVLHTDAQGNKAYVSPDGKQFKEVP